MVTGPTPRTNLFDPDRPIAPAEQLLVIGLPFRVVDGEVLYDLQSRDTLLRYLNSFRTMIVAGPLLPESDLDRAKHLVWVPVPELQDRIQFVPLPPYGSALKFARDLRPTVRLLRRCIDAAKYVQCGIGGGNCGLEHDWGAVAAKVAMRAGRKVCLLADAISYEVPALRARNARSLPVRLKLLLKARLTRIWQHHLISRCDLMFCNGLETFREFTPVVRSPERSVKINDFQIGPEKIMGEAEAEAKWRDVASRTDLRVCYAGRVEPPKAPIDWVNAVAEAHRLGADIKAVWMGDGSLLGRMREEVERLGMSGVIELTGFVTDRDEVINRIRASDVMLFTHIEPESPRVLIEALMSACAIVGYERSHPVDLISGHGGGELTPLGDWKALGAALAGLARDRGRLADLVRKAALEGRRFDSNVMNRFRSELIKERLA
jgi:glycosyltransferase involved in cell wall biosynthesis